MRKHDNRKYLEILLLVVFFSSSGYAQVNEKVLTDNRLQTELDSVVQQAAMAYLQDSNTVGVSIGIYHKGEQYIYCYDKNRLPGTNSFYNIGSVAKTFASTLLAQAVVEGKVDLNEDIRKFMPGAYPNLQFDGQPVRFVHLANHTSGLPTLFRVFSQAVSDSIRKLDMAGQVHFYSLYNADSLLTDLHHVELNALPGTSFQYNNSAMKLLELLLERVYGKSYEQLVTEYVSRHWMMWNTKPFLNKAEIQNAVQGHNGQGVQQSFFNLEGYYFGPTMNSTMDDMLQYIKVNLSSDNKAITLTHELTFRKADGVGIGLGWMMGDRPDGTRYIYHDGNTKIGYNTLCIFYPDKQLGFIIIANDTSNLGNLSHIEQVIYGRL